MLGQRAELKPKRQRLRAECEALRERMRLLSVPHIDVEDLDIDALVDTVIALKSDWSELSEVKRIIGILNKELGE